MSGEQASEAQRRHALQLLDDARKCQQENRPDDATSKMMEARKALEKSLELCPANHKARILLVSYTINSEEYELSMKEALTIYNDLSKEQLRNMKDPVLHLSITHCAKMLSDIDTAISYAKEATEMYAEDPQPYMILGELYTSMGQHPEAEHQCRQALRFNDSPSSKNTLTQQNVYFTQCCLSASLIKQHKYTEAELYLTRAIQIDDRSTLAMHHLVNVYYFQNRKEDAMKVATHIQKLDPADSTIEQKIELIRNAEQHPGHHGSVSPSHRSDPMSAHAGGEATGEMIMDGSLRPPASKVSSARSQEQNKPRPPASGGGKDTEEAESEITKSVSTSKKKEKAEPEDDGFCICCVERGSK